MCCTFMAILLGRSSKDPNLLYPLETWEMNLGDKCELGSQLRPHVMWFGEAVPAMEDAYQVIADTDILIVVGTSLNVYPAAGLIHFAPAHSKKYLVDPKEVPVSDVDNLSFIQDVASAGVSGLTEELLSA